MRRFFCDCGQEIFLESGVCIHCQRAVAYFPVITDMVTLEAAGAAWRICGADTLVKLCGHREQYSVCNAVLAMDDEHSLCLACRLNRTIPDLTREENLARWHKLEEAKRRLLFGLQSLGLPLEAPVTGDVHGLCFDFLEDQRTNPSMPEEFVSTGHHGGVITINVLEADDVQRVWQREQSGERYRTLLGHMRHEIGHYYFELLVTDLVRFEQLFGDPGQPYDEALEHYYAHGPLPGWQQSHISAYASAHPLEDWAECFAHYLHMSDTLETAVQRGLIAAIEPANIDALLSVWDGFSVSLNELNRSLGLRDAYPFVTTPSVEEKLRFVHRMIGAGRW